MPLRGERKETFKNRCKTHSSSLFTAYHRLDAVQVALLERCLAILERKFGSKSYECVEALDKLAGNHNRGCGVVSRAAAAVGFSDDVFVAAADEDCGCVFGGVRCFDSDEFVCLTISCRFYDRPSFIFMVYESVYSRVSSSLANDMRSESSCLPEQVQILS